MVSVAGCHGARTSTHGVRMNDCEFKFMERRSDFWGNADYQFSRERESMTRVIIILVFIKPANSICGAAAAW